MTDRPIIFSAPMVRALMDGRKTQTRRVLKRPKWAQENGWPERVMDEQDLDGRLFWFAQDTGCLSPLPIPQPGDRLWVREAWSGPHDWRAMKPSDRNLTGSPSATQVWYWAEGNPSRGDWEKPRPSIHMPRWASRLTLTVTDVRVQRLQDIGEADAEAEGIEVRLGHHDEDVFKNYGEGLDISGYGAAKSSFRTLWNSLYGPDAWDANPWVAAISFDTHRCNIDQMKETHHD